MIFNILMIDDSLFLLNRLNTRKGFHKKIFSIGGKMSFYHVGFLTTNNHYQLTMFFHDVSYRIIFEFPNFNRKNYK